MSEFSSLREVMSAEQAEGDLFDWRVVEAELGTGLPADYKEFMSVYGTGSVGTEGLTVLPPTAPEGYPYRADEMADESVNLRDMWNDRWDEDLVIPGLDAPEQLLAWGVGHSEPDLYGWIMTSAEPDEWPVVVWRRDEDPDFVHFDMGMVEFLRRLTTGDLPENPASNDFVWGMRKPYLGWRAKLA
ncbi:SMI1/KNR4 family protein [Actinophytocola sediminis]